MARSRSETIKVEVAKIGGIVVPVCLNDERTVEDALRAAGIDYQDGQRIRVEGKEADMDTELRNGQMVTLSSKVKGG